MTHARIEINPTIMFGKPVIKGTRITVEQILDVRKLAGGMTVDEILCDHPHLVLDDVMRPQPLRRTISLKKRSFLPMGSACKVPGR